MSQDNVIQIATPEPSSFQTPNEPPALSTTEMREMAWKLELLLGVLFVDRARKERGQQRNESEFEKIHELAIGMEKYVPTLVSKGIDHDTMLANLTAVQKRCTELTLELREAKASTKDSNDPALACALQDLKNRIIVARMKHPEGASFPALIEEVGEVATAMIEGNEAAAQSERLDVGTVVMRLYLGEVMK